jgi:hypothetical protein
MTIDENHSTLSNSPPPINMITKKNPYQNIKVLIEMDDLHKVNSTLNFMPVPLIRTVFPEHVLRSSETHENVDMITKSVLRIGHNSHPESTDFLFTDNNSRRTMSEENQ